MKTSLIGACLVAVSLLLAACQTAGTGSGNVRGSRKPVAFPWQSKDSVSGDITATFGTGRVFTGQYFQITQDTRMDRLDPLWYGWDRPPRGAWGYRGAHPGPQFPKTSNRPGLSNPHPAKRDHTRRPLTAIHP